MPLHRAKTFPPPSRSRPAFQAVWVLAEDIPIDRIVSVVRQAALDLAVEVTEVRIDQRHVIVGLRSTDHKVAFASSTSVKARSGDQLAREFGPFYSSVWTPGLFVGMSHD